MSYDTSSNQLQFAESALPVALPLPSIANLPACVEDVRKTLLMTFQGPEDPLMYDELHSRLEAAAGKLPPLYRQTVYQPFMHILDQLGSEGFRQVLLADPQRVRVAGLMFDIAQAILQNGEGYQREATDAFQELVSDIYDGFLSAEDRRHVKKPDHSIIPPLVKWGRPEYGPYTHTIMATRSFGLKTAIVSMPPVYAQRGLLVWFAAGHEVGGHDILHADEGLLDELALAVRSSLVKHRMDAGLTDYWTERINETASDVLGILNMGPAAVAAMIGAFRGGNAAYLGNPLISNSGNASSPHPAEIVRCYLGAYAVGMLQFDQAEPWAALLESEVDRNLDVIHLAGVAYNTEDVKHSAKLTAAAILKTKLKSLERHSLDEIQNWSNRDEAVTLNMRRCLTRADTLHKSFAQGYYAAHVVAAAIMEAIAEVGADLDLLFRRMIAFLKTMHDHNPSWGPLYVEHPGNVARRYLFERKASAAE